MSNLEHLQNVLEEVGEIEPEYVEKKNSVSSSNKVEIKLEGFGEVVEVKELESGLTGMYNGDTYLIVFHTIKTSSGSVITTVQKL